MDDFLFAPKENFRSRLFEKRSQPFCFDDGSIGHLNGLNGERKDPSPASVLEQWKLSLRSRECIDAVAAIIVGSLRFLRHVSYDPKLELRIREMHRLAVAAKDWGKISKCCELLGVFASERGKAMKAGSWYSKSIDAHLSMTRVDRARMDRLLKRYERYLKSVDKLDGWPPMKLDIMMKASLKNRDFYGYRQLALEMYKLGEYEKAEKAYLTMIDKGFTVVSNYCHLVRLRIAADRIEEAEQALKQAVALRDSCPRYVLARIHFFNVVFRYIKGSNARADLRELNVLLKKESAYMHWEIDAMLERLEDRIPDKQLGLLRVLGLALQSPSNRSVLDENLLWTFSVSEDEASVGTGSAFQTHRWGLGRDHPE